MCLVFVYGTLMSDQRANHYLDGCELLGTGVLKDYGLYDNGLYPCAVPVKGF